MKGTAQRLSLAEPTSSPQRSRAARRAVAAIAAVAAASAVLLPPRLTAEDVATAPVVIGPEQGVASVGHFPTVAVVPGGRAVVAWVGPGASTSSQLHSVLARRYQHDQPRGGELAVSSLSQADLRDPQVAMTPRGDFAVVWADLSPRPEVATAIRGQLFRADGRPRGGELAIGPRDVATAHPEVALGPDGRFAVAWEQTTDDPRLGVRLATFDAGGRPLARPRVMTALGATANLMGGLSAAADSVTVGWTEVTPCPQQPIDPVSAVATFDWRLRALGGVERLANDNPCIDGPRVLAVLGSERGPLGVFEGRRYSIQRFSDASGERVGPRTNIADLPSCSPQACERVAAVAGDGRGRFVLVWERMQATGDQFDLFVQLYGREGLPRSERFRVNTDSSLMEQQPAAALAADGTLLVVWRRDGAELLLRRFELP